MLDTEYTYALLDHLHSDSCYSTEQQYYASDRLIIRFQSEDAAAKSIHPTSATSDGKRMVPMCVEWFSGQHTTHELEVNYSRLGF